MPPCPALPLGLSSGPADPLLADEEPNDPRGPQPSEGGGETSQAAALCNPTFGNKPHSQSSKPDTPLGEPMLRRANSVLSLLTAVQSQEVRTCSPVTHVRLERVIRVGPLGLVPGDTAAPVPGQVTSLQAPEAALPHKHASWPG